MLREITEDQYGIIWSVLHLIDEYLMEAPRILMSNSEFCLTINNEDLPRSLDKALRSCGLDEIAKVSKNDKVTEVKINF